jgi:siroheme synthase-like protein
MLGNGGWLKTSMLNVNLDNSEIPYRLSVQSGDIKMGYAPFFLNMDGVACLIVGGGNVALRKAQMLLECGARVDVVAPKFTDAWSFAKLSARDELQLRILKRRYDPAIIGQYRFAIAASDDMAVNEQVARNATDANIWVNVVDAPEHCTALAATSTRRGPIHIAVGTNGACPALASAIRDAIEETCPEWLALFAEELRDVRTWLQEHCRDTAVRGHILRKLAAGSQWKLYQRLDDETLRTVLRNDAKRQLDAFTAKDGYWARTCPSSENNGVVPL